jgi:hypothetical protein
MPSATSTLSIARRTLLRDSSSVLPCSIVTVLAMSSKRRSIRFLSANRCLTRCTGGVARQPGYALSAAFTAASTSAAAPSGTFASTTSVTGLRISPNSVEAERDQRPPM